jgi:hypothetical protein
MAVNIKSSERNNRNAAKNWVVSFGDLGVLGGLAVLLSSNTEIGHYPP